MSHDLTTAHNFTWGVSRSWKRFVRNCRWCVGARLADCALRDSTLDMTIHWSWEILTESTHATWHTSWPNDAQVWHVWHVWHVSFWQDSYQGECALCLDEYASGDCVTRLTCLHVRAQSHQSHLCEIVAGEKCGGFVGEKIRFGFFPRRFTRRVWIPGSTGTPAAWSLREG